MKKKDIWISLAIIATAGLMALLYLQRKGYLGIDAGGADAALRLTNGWLSHVTITSGAETAKIDARIYRPQHLRLSMGQNGHTWRIESRGPWADLSKLKVGNNETVKIRLGPPFLIKSRVHKQGSVVSIGYTIIGRAGEQYQNLITKDGRAVTGATINIIGEAGKVLESGKFKYG